MPWMMAASIIGAMQSQHLQQKQQALANLSVPYPSSNILVDEVTSTTDEEDVFLKLKGYVCEQTLTMGVDDPVKSIWRLYKKVGTT